MSNGWTVGGGGAVRYAGMASRKSSALATASILADYEQCLVPKWPKDVRQIHTSPRLPCLVSSTSWGRFGGILCLSMPKSQNETCASSGSTIAANRVVTHIVYRCKRVLETQNRKLFLVDLKFEWKWTLLRICVTKVENLRLVFSEQSCRQA